MDMWEKMPREDRYRNRREYPSFSSTLLDAIYHSIDESDGSKRGEELVFYRETTMRKKQSNNNCSLKQEEMTRLQRACMIEKWMEKKAISCDNNNKVAIRRKSMADSERNSRNDYDPMLLNSSSTSSDSSCGGGFSSSESDSFYGAKSRSSSSSSSHYTSRCHSHRPKPIRMSVSAQPERYERPQHEAENNFHAVAATQKPKHEGGFVRTKSKALKIYSDLKKVKQPISPGGRLASFLNSLFTAGNPKKAKISSSGTYEEKNLKSEQAKSTCSSASSFSRSCLTKTSSSSRENGTKRSVRFCPVSVILDEDSRPCGHKNILHENDHQTSIRKELEFRIMEENRRVAEAAKELLNCYQKKKKKQKLKEEYDMRDMICNGDEDSTEDEADDDDEDAASYASSDLFELDNLSAIGNERYREELPVYETTHLDTNRAIANGLIV